MVRAVVDGGLSQATVAGLYNATEDGRQMGWTVPHGRCRGFAGSFLKASFIAEPNPAGHMRGR